MPLHGPGRVSIGGWQAHLRRLRLLLHRLPMPAHLNKMPYQWLCCAACLYQTMHALSWQGQAVFLHWVHHTAHAKDVRRCNRHLTAALAAGTRQANRIRHRYLAAVLRQDVAFFDEKASGGLMQGLNEDIVAIQNASPLLLIYAALCYSQCPTLVVSYASDVAAAAVSPPVRAAWCTSHLCIVLSVQCPHPRLQPSGIAPLPNWASIPNLQPVTCWTGCSSAPGLQANS